MHLLLFAASVRSDSCNKKLISLAAQIAKSQPNVTIDLANFTEFDVPLYDGDMNAKIGLPENALKFIQRLKKSQGLIIASPEYNFSIPGRLKNLIDWVSRASPVPFMRQPILLMSASPSLVGGNRGLWATRIPLECCGSYVFPDMFSLSSAYEAFENDDQLKDPAAQQRLKNNIGSFIQYVEQMTAKLEQ